MSFWSPSEDDGCCAHACEAERAEAAERVKAPIIRHAVVLVNIMGLRDSAAVRKSIYPAYMRQLNSSKAIIRPKESAANYLMIFLRHHIITKHHQVTDAKCISSYAAKLIASLAGLCYKADELSQFPCDVKVP